MIKLILKNVLAFILSALGISLIFVLVVLIVLMLCGGNGYGYTADQKIANTLIPLAILPAIPFCIVGYKTKLIGVWVAVIIYLLYYFISLLKFLI